MQKSLQRRSPRSRRSVDGEGRAWLTPKGEHVAVLLTKNPRAAAFMPASQLAKEIGVNTATVVRFAQLLGFSGWKEFQLHFRHLYLAQVLPSEMGRERPKEQWDSPFDAVVHQDVENVQATLSTVDRDEFADVVRTLDAAGKTVVLSSGSYAAVAHVLVHMMNVMGYDARLETRGGIHAITALSNLTSQDCVVAVSFLRLVRHVVVGCEEAQRRGITTVAITDSVFSPLARAATHTVMVPTESISWFQSLTAAMSVVNALASELHALAGERVDEAIKHVEALYGDFDVLYDRDRR